MEASGRLAGFELCYGRPTCGVSPMDSIESYVKTFAEQRFIVLRNFLDPYLVQFLASYFKCAEGYQEAVFETDWTSANAHSDACGDTVMYVIRSAIEAHTGLKLLPTYSFVRMYSKGDSLGRHKDGKQNQVSCNICIEKDSDWPLGISDGKEDHTVIMEPGDAVIYQGYALDHWREKFTGGRQVQLISGYVVEGGEYENLRFYGRGGPMYFPTGAKRAGPIKLVKGRLARLKQKLFGHEPQI